MSDPRHDGDPVTSLSSRPREGKTPAKRGAPIGRLHGLAIGGMVTFAVVGSLAALAFITVGWPGDMGHYVVTVMLFAAIGFTACASAAVLSAARDTYPSRGPQSDDQPPE